MTIKEIAKLCGVSASTVSKVINNYPTIPEATKERIRAVMEKYNYVPNAAASGLSSGTFRNVGILGFLNNDDSPFSHPLFSQILVHFQAEINKHGYDLLFVDKLIQGREGSYLQNCRSRNVSGVLLFGSIVDKMTVDLMRSDIPTIAFDYYGGDTFSVHCNNIEAMEKLTDYCVTQGHKDIMMLSGDDNIVSRYRLLGYKNSLYKNHIDVKDENIRVIPFYDYEKAFETTKDIILNRPDITCILYPDDYTAIVGMKAAASLEKRVPQDISIAGFDGLGIGSLLPKVLTTMRQDVEIIGKTLATHLVDMMENGKKAPQNIELEATLIPGESVGKLA